MRRARILAHTVHESNKVYFKALHKHTGKGTFFLTAIYNEVTVHNGIRSDGGRILILEVNIDNEQLALANIYAPNEIQALQKFSLES